jgi:hypothetical protein
MVLFIAVKVFGWYLKLITTHHRNPPFVQQRRYEHLFLDRKIMTPQVMTPVPMIEPSSWLRSGITVEKTDGVNLVKFTDDLHARLEALLEKRKAELLTPLEEAEYAGISELERILTLVNAKLIASRDS